MENNAGLTLIKPVAQPQELIAYHEEVAKLIQGALKEGVDYGVIPGTGDKPTLLKPGAERLCLAFGASPEYALVDSTIDHDREIKYQKRKKVWNNAFKGDRTFRHEQEDGISYGLYRYVYSCRILRSDGRCLGMGVGVCSTMETKYIDRPRDCENIVAKMAQKRALVAAVLNAFGLSNRFTQDVEDYHYETIQAKAQEIFTGTTEQQKRAAAILTDAGIPETAWDEVCHKMNGRPCNKKELMDVAREIYHRQGQ